MESKIIKNRASNHLPHFFSSLARARSSQLIFSCCLLSHKRPSARDWPRSSEGHHMDDLGAAEAPPEAAAAAAPSSGPTPSSTTMLESPPTAQENADPLQVRPAPNQVQFPSCGSRDDNLDPSRRRFGHQEVPSMSHRRGRLLASISKKNSAPIGC